MTSEQAWRADMLRHYMHVQRRLLHLDQHPDDDPDGRCRLLLEARAVLILDQLTITGEDRQ